MQDGQGSKTSLLSKEAETPRKKGRKKKKVTKKTVTVDDEFGESTWAEDLNALADDILPSGKATMDKEEEEREDGEEKEETLKQPTKMKTTFLTGPMMKSQPLDKIFVESSSKFPLTLKIQCIINYVWLPIMYIYIYSTFQFLKNDCVYTWPLYFLRL